MFSMTTQGEPDEWLGRGLYSMAEASRLLGVVPEKLTRWIVGRSWVGRKGFQELRPTMVTRIHQLDDRPTLTFVDLIELLFIKGFRDTGLSLQHIRAAAEKAAEIFHTDHPFTMKRFATDGKQIFSTIAVEGHDERMMELLKGQLVFTDVLERYLKQLDYDLDTGSAVRWWPRGKAGLVKVDPRIAFGAPTVAMGVPTEAIFRAFHANGLDAAVVARWYEVPEPDVRAAVDYETELSSRKAA